MNDFYSASGNPATGSPGSSATVRAEFAAIKDAFDKMPALTGQGNKVVRINAAGNAMEATDTLTAITITTATINGGTINNTVIGGTTRAAGNFTTLDANGNVTLGDAAGDTITINGTTTFANVNPTLTAGTANGVAYLDGSKVLTSGSALTFDGTNLGLGGAAVAVGSGPVLEIYSGANNGILKFTNSTTGTTNSDGTWLYQPAGSNSFIIQNQESAGDLRLYSTTHVWGNHNYSTEYMRLTSTGLGIGTSSPISRLTVSANGTLGGGEQFNITGANTDIRLRLGIDTSTNKGSIQALVANVGFEDLLLNPAGGNVGIGTSSPEERLNIAGASGTAVLSLERTNTGFGGGKGAVGWKSLNGFFTAAITEVTDAGSDDGGGLVFRTMSGSTTTNAYAVTERLRIDSSGNVGIGTSSPGSRLSVGGGISSIGNSDLSASVSGSAIYAGGFGSPDIGRLIIGDGTGWRYHISRRSGSTNTDLVTFTDAGNLGLGVTPSAWSGFPALQTVSGYSVSPGGFGQNTYYNAGFKYIATGGATLYQPTGSQHIFYTAPSGTAGNAISFTQAMTLDASGNLGIGTSSPAFKLSVQGNATLGGANPFLAFNADASGGATPTYIERNGTTGLQTFYNNGTGTNGAMAFVIGAGSEGMRIDSAGNVGIGTSSPQANLEVSAPLGSSGPTLRLSSTGASATSQQQIGALDFFNSDADIPGVAAYVRALAGPSFGVGGQLVFGTQETWSTGVLRERLRIDSSGNLIVGGTGASAKTHVIQGTAGNDSLWVENTAGNNVNRFRAATGLDNYIDFYAGAASGSLIFRGAGTERLRIDSSGHLLIGSTSIANTRLGVRGATTDNTQNALLLKNSDDFDLLQVRNDGHITTGTRTLSPYNNTTASAANMFVDANGVLFRSTSSAKYKTDIEDAPHGLAEVMALRSVVYKGKTDGDRVFGGFIAEEVHDAGLTEFVEYADDGTPDALAYGHMVALMAKAIQEQQAQIAALTARITALESA